MTRKMKRQSLRRLYLTPLYAAEMVLSVSEDMTAARIKEDDFLGSSNPADWENAVGFYSNDGCGRLGIFLSFQNTTHGVIAHEVMHVTHRILQFAGVRFSTDNHEPFTYLNQHLTSWIYQQLKRARIRVHA